MPINADYFFLLPFERKFHYMHQKPYCLIKYDLKCIQIGMDYEKIIRNITLAEQTLN